MAHVSLSVTSFDVSADQAALSEHDKNKNVKPFPDRLQEFYWAHDPRKVDRVHEILATHRGKEEQFLERLHRQFGVRDFGGEEAIDDIYEHQRYSFLSFSWGASFPGHLLPTDRRQWSGLYGSPSSQTREEVEPQLPVNWKWTNDWVVDKTSTKCDSDGWVYALDFKLINCMIGKGQERSEPNATDYVRRRRWVRTRRRVLPNISSTNNDVKEQCLGRIDNTVSWVVCDDKEVFRGSLAEQTKDCALVETEIDANPKKVQSERSEAPPTPPKQATTSHCIELQHYSIDLNTTSLDTAWKTAVNDMEAIYIRLKEQRAQQKHQWSLTKEKLKRQIQLLESTIRSLQAVLLKEEKKRQQNKHQRHTSTGSTTSSTRKSAPNAAFSTSINVRTRLHCAQSKLDALRRHYWHPRENGYSLRFSIDGIYYGLRDFFVERFDSSFSMKISYQTNGAQGITPTCKISMKGHTICCGKHVKVVGEKGTRIPKSIWDSMYMDSDFEACVNLIYVEEVNTLSTLGHGRWEFLLSPEATYVELLNFTRRAQGGLDLPEVIVRKLCSDALSSFIRDTALLYFPPEVALAFNMPPAKFDVKGEIKVTGQPIDDMMEKELQEINMDVIDEAQAQARARKKRNDGFESPDGESTRPILDATASDAQMQAIAKVLNLSLPQFNLLVALKNCGLFPSTYNFCSLSSICAYYNAFSINNEAEDQKNQDQKLRAVWKRVLELVYIRKLQGTKMFKVKSPHKPSSAVRNACRSRVQYELFDVDKFFDTIKHLSTKPVDLKVSITHFDLILDMLNVVEALTKLYERLVLGIDYSKPRTQIDSFMFGIRLGRKAVASTENGVHPVASQPFLESNSSRPDDISFQTRVETVNKFWKMIIEFVIENVDDVSAEIAGKLQGDGEKTLLEGSFKDANIRGPVSIQLAVPACFLGFYRTEMVALSENAFGIQVDVMLPFETIQLRTGEDKQQLFKSLERVGRVVLADLSSEVCVDLDALLIHEEKRREQVLEANMKSSTTESIKHPQGTISKKPNEHCALSFRFDSATAFGRLSMRTSEFTKLHTMAKTGSFMLRVRPILDYLLTEYIRPRLLESFPQHQVLYDTVIASILHSLQSAKLEVSFNVLVRAFVHENERLMVTFCGSPLNPTPITFTDEVKLLDLIFQVDDLVNMWTDDRQPPHSNPLYF